tara:strand:- start:2622 stop:2822 length:201 start_codon:yes stop_codon:yes gene_type:complete
MFIDWTIPMTRIMSKESLKKFIKKYQEISDHTMDDEDAAWKQGADELMSALRIDIAHLEKYNEINE